jgi:hypothetical protein
MALRLITSQEKSRGVSRREIEALEVAGALKFNEQKNDRLGQQKLM